MAALPSAPVIAARSTSGPTGNGDPALAAVTPDLAFIDLHMARMDGLELVRRLRAREGGRRVRLVAMSASVLTFNRDDAFVAGSDDFLPKPFRESELLEKLGRLLQFDWTQGDAVWPADATVTAPATAGSLDAAILAELLGAARRGEIAALRDRLAQLRGSTSDPLLDTLETLARSYRMEEIRTLLELQRAAGPSASCKRSAPSAAMLAAPEILRPAAAAGRTSP